MPHARPAAATHSAAATSASTAGPAHASATVGATRAGAFLGCRQRLEIGFVFGGDDLRGAEAQGGIGDFEDVIAFGGDDGDVGGHAGLEFEIGSCSPR